MVKPDQHIESTSDDFLRAENILPEQEIDVHEGIRQGLDDADHGRLRSAREFFDEFEAKHKILRQ